MGYKGDINLMFDLLDDSWLWQLLGCTICQIFLCIYVYVRYGIHLCT